MNVSRLKELCVKVWNLLTLEERERYYYGDGTIQFVYDVSDIAFMDADDLTEEALDEILDELGEPDDEE